MYANWSISVHATKLQRAKRHGMSHLRCCCACCATKSRDKIAGVSSSLLQCFVANRKDIRPVKPLTRIRKGSLSVAKVDEGRRWDQITRGHVEKPPGADGVFCLKLVVHFIREPSRRL